MTNRADFWMRLAYAHHMARLRRLLDALAPAREWT